MQKYFEVGQIVNTFGINGTVKVKPFTDWWNWMIWIIEECIHWQR